MHMGAFGRCLGLADLWSCRNPKCGYGSWEFEFQILGAKFDIADLELL